MSNNLNNLRVTVVLVVLWAVGTGMINTVFGQCHAQMYYNVESNKRPKVGKKCTIDGTNVWFLKSITGITSVRSTQVDPYGSSDTLTWNDNGTAVTTDPKTFADGQADTSSITYDEYLQKACKATTTYNSGNGSYSADFLDSPYTYVKDTATGDWSVNGQPNTYAYDSTISAMVNYNTYVPEPVYGWFYDICDSSSESNTPAQPVYVSTTVCEGSYQMDTYNTKSDSTCVNYGFYTTQKLTQESKYNTQYSDSDLREHVVKMIPTYQASDNLNDWQKGFNGQAFYKIAPDHSWISCQRMEYRMVIPDSIKGASYHLKWYEKQVSDTGTLINSTPRKCTITGTGDKVKPAEGIVFYIKVPSVLGTISVTKPKVKITFPGGGSPAGGGGA